MSKHVLIVSPPDNQWVPVGAGPEVQLQPQLNIASLAAEVEHDFINPIREEQVQAEVGGVVQNLKSAIIHDCKEKKFRYKNLFTCGEAVRS